ncbi:MAG: hypothetical protein V4722_18570 [Bacteroidota bacterium]
MDQHFVSGRWFLHYRSLITSKILLTLLFAALFLLFYAPSRMVFLATDWAQAK